ncbi:MAG TPA: alkaline phosphatase family protein, partial [Thermoanaerobaculia bacterium]|nr:alkaline phosphatase family protein [Thermoanaerobaculia bacterium]
MNTLKKLLIAGFLFGSLTYGAALGFIHVVYNGVDSARNGLAIGIDFDLLYGLWALAVFAIVHPLVNLIPKIWNGGSGDPFWRGMLWGLFLFNFVFWSGYALYGLTYDQGPFGPIATRFGMVCWIATLLVATAIGGWLLSLVILAIARWFSAARRPRRILVVAYSLWLALCALAPMAMGEGEASRSSVGNGPLPQVQDNRVKVALIGIDGASWRVIGPMVARGELPNFKRMIAGGASGVLATLHDSNSAVIWASIYTGRLPEDDGILDSYRIHLPGMSGKGIFPVHRTYF